MHGYHRFIPECYKFRRISSWVAKEHCGLSPASPANLVVGEMIKSVPSTSNRHFIACQSSQSRIAPKWSDGTFSSSTGLVSVGLNAPSTICALTWCSKKSKSIHRSTERPTLQPSFSTQNARVASMSVTANAK